MMSRKLIIFNKTLILKLIISNIKVVLVRKLHRDFRIKEFLTKIKISEIIAKISNNSLKKVIFKLIRDNMKGKMHLNLDKQRLIKE